MALEQEVKCPDCGAVEMTCETRFHELLVKEFTDAGYGAVHHLTVTAYMLQHSSKMTREGWLHERELLRKFLIEKKSPALVKRENKDLVESSKRKFKINSKDGVPVIHKNIWRKTILDIRAENADMYCGDVTAWARSALEEAEAITT